MSAPTFDAVKEASRGRWPEIWGALGIHDLPKPGKHGPCPGCGGRDRFRLIVPEVGSGGWICGQGGEPTGGDGFDLLRHVHGWDKAEALRRVAEALGLDGSETKPSRTTRPKPRQATKATTGEKGYDIEERVRAALKAAVPCAGHDYLKRKGLRPDRLRVDAGGWLLFPMRDADGHLCGCQRVAPDGQKRTVRGSKLAGAHWLAMAPKADLPLLVVEGPADALALREAGIPAACAFGTNNLQKAAEAIEARFPGVRMVLGPDNDDAGRKAASGSRWPVIYPPREGADWADLLPELGPEGLAKVVREATDEAMSDLAEQEAEEAPTTDHKPKHPLDGRRAGAYVVEDGRLYREVTRGDDTHTVVVANFAAHITREVLRTDGAESRFLFEVEGWLDDGRPLPKALVPAKEFAGLGWVVEAWGCGAMVYPGPAAKDHCRAAIQMMSRPERAIVYAHLGWAEIEGRHVYIHAGGGIGADGAVEKIEVDPGDALAGFVLPEPPHGEDAASAVREVLHLPGTVAPDRILWPLVLAVLAAAVEPPPISIYAAGRTGARKTALAMVVQAFFGHRRTEPPASWEATANFLEGLAFAAKDTALLIDDYAPTGDARARDAMKRTAARVLRDQGNRAARGRMNKDLTLGAGKPPRGVLIVTGEDLPPGHSVRARCLFLDVEPGDVDLGRLTEAQRLAREGRYAAAMAAWVRWLAPRLDDARERVRARIEELRPRWQSAHGRTTDAVAALFAAWELFAEFSTEVCAINSDQAIEIGARIAAALDHVAEAQAAAQRSADPVERFPELLASLFSSGRAHLQRRDGEPRPPEDPQRWGWRGEDSGMSGTRWGPLGASIGWTDGEHILLDPAAAYAALDRLAQETGEALPSARTFWKRLAEKGVIRAEHAKDGVRVTPVRRIAGRRKRVVEISVGVCTEKTGDTGDGSISSCSDSQKAVTGNFSVTGKSGDTPKTPDGAQGYADGVSPVRAVTATPTGDGVLPSESTCCAGVTGVTANFTTHPTQHTETVATAPPQPRDEYSRAARDLYRGPAGDDESEVLA